MKRLIAGTVLIAACGSASGGSTIGPTTTSLVTETSTSSSTTSTTSIGSDLVPAVASRYGLLGWWSSGWVVPEALDDIPLTGDEEYQLVMLDQPITTAVGSAPSLCEPSLTPVLDFDPPLPGEFGEPGALAVIADWELRPSPVRVEADLADPHYQAVKEVLVTLGLDTDPAIFQVVMADIDVDGTEEIVIVAKDLPADLFGHPGNYSVVVLRKMIEGDWQTALLETSVGASDNPYILSHSVAAVADLNGDGTMEIVVDAVYYEGSGTTAYEYIDDDLGPQPVLGGGCGA